MTPPKERGVGFSMLWCQERSTEPPTAPSFIIGGATGDLEETQPALAAMGTTLPLSVNRPRRSCQAMQERDLGTRLSADTPSTLFIGCYCVARRRSTSIAMSGRKLLQLGQYSDGDGILNQ